ncbi:MAG TPA: ATP-binding protein, partial [Gemmatimonadales bacterium]|nr:ATP-binding protein [Gemmatimonadales bacterium]
LHGAEPRSAGLLLYLFLSLALAGMVFIALWSNGHLRSAMQRTIAASEFWAPKFQEVSSVGGLVSAVDAPGNEVFLNGNVPEARAEMHRWRDSLTVRLGVLRTTLPAGLEPRDSTLIVVDLARIEAATTTLVAQAESLFAAYRPGREGAAGRHMAKMDEAYAVSLRAIRTLRADVSAAQDARIRRERGTAASSDRLLRWSAVAMLLLAVGGAWLGLRLVREARRQAAERERAFRMVTTAQAELEAAHADLTQAHQEMESFSYSVAHDLRAPLRSIEGFSAALQEDLGPTLQEETREHLERIRAASVRMSALIEELLKLSRLTRQSLVTTPLDLTAMAEEIVAELRAHDPARTVRVTIAPGLTAHGDPALIRALLQNLLANAWKFTRHAPAPAIEFTADPQIPGSPPVFVVRDNGAGFDMKFATKLFGAFQRMHTVSEFEGTGVGLATVKRIVQRHGGRVWADAAPGQGATFRFTLRT